MMTLYMYLFATEAHIMMTIRTTQYKTVRTALKGRCFIFTYTVSGKKVPLDFFAVTLPNPNRSSKFFYLHTQQ